MADYRAYYAPCRNLKIVISKDNQAQLPYKKLSNGPPLCKVNSF